MNDLVSDWKVNKGNNKGRLVMLLFRLAKLIRYNIFLLVVIGWAFLPLYVFFVEWVLGIEIRWNLKLGKRIQLWHGQSLIINSGSIIGDDCVLRHSTTIGNKDSDNRCPVIGNNVNIGAGVIILGNITIGNNVIIAAGSIVIKDIPNNVMVAGNPAQIKKYI